MPARSSTPTDSPQAVPPAARTPTPLQTRKKAQALARAGSSVNQFCDAVGYCRATLYNLPSELRPFSVKIGRRRIIIEQPADYLARLAAAASKVN
jgi:hypothetical protein